MTSSKRSDRDWFRFWPKGEEDSDPSKAEQYSRWRELRKLQEQNARQPQQPNPPWSTKRRERGGVAGTDLGQGSWHGSRR